MMRYMAADFLRIIKRIPRIIALVLVFGITGYIFYFFNKDGKTSVYELVDILVKIVPYISAVFGLAELISVYSDDFKAKTMQVAIGSGIGRPQVILAKWLETGILCLCDYLFFIVLIFVLSSIQGISFSGGPAVDVILLFVFGWVKAFVCIGMTQILLFGTLSFSGGVLLYLGLCSGIAGGLVSLLLDAEIISSLRLSSYLFTNLLEVAQSRAIIGTISLPQLLGILLYAAVSFVLSCLLFRKREMEF